MGKIKEHFKENYKYYLAGAGGAALAGITVIIMRESRTVLQGGADRPETESTGSFIFSNRFALKTQFNNNTITTTISKESRGHPGYITKCIDTNEFFETQGAAARAFDIPESLLSAHINGRVKDVDGHMFERVGVFS